MNMDDLSYADRARVNKAFSRPPVFGDTEQIFAVRITEPVYPPEGMKRYRVTVEFTGEVTEDVDAEDEEQAEELVRDEIDIPSGCDVEVTVKEIIL